MKIKKMLVAILCTSLFIVTGCEDNKLGVDNGTKGSAKQVSSQAELTELFKRNQRESLYTDNWGGVKDNAATPESSTATSEGSSKTNVQVEGVDEGDIVKVDGDYIYKMQTSGFVIYHALGDGKLEEASSVKIENYAPQEMYLTDDQLIIIGGTYKTVYDGGWYGRMEPGLYVDCFTYHTDVDVRVYDITDRSNIILEQQVNVSGYYVTSRRIDNTLYMINNYYEYYVKDTGEIKAPIPTIAIDGGESKPIDLSDIYYYDDCIGYNYLNLVKIDLDNAKEVEVKSYLANFSGNIYVSSNYIYSVLTSYEYETLPFVGVTNYVVFTNVQRYSLKTLLNDVTYKAPGYVKDRYSMDEYNDYFRMAVTNNIKGESCSAVYVYDKDAKLVGKVEGLAPGETIYSARFDKNLAYVVTFRITDPLYVIDMSDVSNLKVTSELKKDGVSLYLQKFKDGQRMLGLGYNTKDGRTIGLEVILYNVENSEETVVLDQYLTQNNSVYIEAMYNPKTMLFMEELNLFGFSAEEYYYNYSNYYDNYSTQGYYVFKVTEKGTLELTILSNIEPFYYKEYSNNYDYNHYINRYKQYITRGVVIGDYLYTISDAIIGVYRVSDLSLVNKYKTVKE
jgi:uncharacterized secreted protein with C-terminal beta-propeller domain